jgi:hypothetical protein
MGPRISVSDASVPKPPTTVEKSEKSLARQPRVDPSQKQKAVQARGGSYLPADIHKPLFYRLASNTTLNGVSAARRKWWKPPDFTTSPMRFSPACAPSARPTSCDSEAGVQIMVEAA